MWPMVDCHPGRKTERIVNFFLLKIQRPCLFLANVLTSYSRTLTVYFDIVIYNNNNNYYYNTPHVHAYGFVTRLRTE